MNEDLHFRQRLQQRFGLGGDEIVRSIEVKTANPNSFVEFGVNGNTIHRFHWGEQLLYVVRGRTDKGLVTVLTHRQYVLNEVE